MLLLNQIPLQVTVPSRTSCTKNKHFAALKKTRVLGSFFHPKTHNRNNAYFKIIFLPQPRLIQCSKNSFMVCNLVWAELHPLQKSCIEALCACMGAELFQLCPSLCDPMDHSLPDFSVHGILQGRILEWVAIPFSRNLPDPGGESRRPVLQADSLPSEPQLPTIKSD